MSCSTWPPPDMNIGRTRIDHAFAQRKLTPRIVLEAIDSDVITTYVRLGLGIGIVAEVAVRELKPVEAGGDLAVRPVGHLFGQNVTRVAFKLGVYLRNFVFKFAEFLSERLTRPLIGKAMNGWLLSPQRSLLEELSAWADARDIEYD